jgi:hypothetical protein
MDMLLRLQVMSFVALLVHQFEEYGYPGGEPAIMNMALRNSDLPDRYPLNQHSAMFTNVVSAYLIYVLPIIFPHVIWLGLIPMLFGIGQFVIHGIVTNIKLRTFYNPGLGAVVFLHFPIGFYYIWFVQTQGLASWTDWLFGVLGLIFSMAVLVAFLTYRVFPDKNTKYVFAPEEMARFDVAGKLAKIKRS